MNKSSPGLLFFCGPRARRGAVPGPAAAAAPGLSRGRHDISTRSMTVPAAVPKPVEGPKHRGAGGISTSSMTAPVPEPAVAAVPELVEGPSGRSA
jgi:hypothetical protein